MEEEKVQSKAGEIEKMTYETIAKTTSKGKGMIESGKNQAANRLDHVAEAFRRAGQNMLEKDEAVASYSATAADRIDDLARYLRNVNAEDLAEQAESFARKRPEIFLGGAFALGFLLSRFFKSSGLKAEYEPVGQFQEPVYTGATASGWQRETAGFGQAEKTSAQSSSAAGPTT